MTNHKVNWADWANWAVWAKIRLFLELMVYFWVETEFLFERNFKQMIINVMNYVYTCSLFVKRALSSYIKYLFEFF